MTIQTYIPLDEAADRCGLDTAVLNRAIESGRMEAVQVGGQLAISKEDMKILAIGESEDLKGQPIRVTKAAEKYDVHQATLSRWADAGYIEIIEREPKVLLLDEAEVKQVSTIYKKALRETGSPKSAGWVLKRTMRYLRQK
jgi:predicted site-specific integrase-resolvase